MNQKLDLSQLIGRLSGTVRAGVSAAIENLRFERTDDSRIYLPKERLFIGGVFAHRVNDGPWAMDANLWTNEGLLDLLKAYLNNTTARDNLYVALYDENIAPVGTLAASTFNSTMGEFVNYTEPTRPLWNKGTITTLPATNAANPSRFTIGADGAASVVCGAALLSSSAKASSTGVMPVITAFDEPRTGLKVNDKIDIEYALTATSED